MVLACNMPTNFILIKRGEIMNKILDFYKQTSPAFPVPDRYVEEIISTDLGKVMDKIFQENDLRSVKGGISFFTNGVISRIDQTKEAFVMALNQHINEVWNDKKVLKK